MEEEPVEELVEAAPLDDKVGSDDAGMLLLGIPERVSDVLAGLSPEQLGYRHGPAFPTAEEIARHLAAAGGRLDLEITALVLGTPPAEPVAQSAPADDVPLAELLQDWQRRRRRAADLLRGVAEDRWEDGLAEVCRQGLNHEVGHLSQLRNLTALIPVA